MRKFILGFILGSILAAGIVYAQADVTWSETKTGSKMVLESGNINFIAKQVGIHCNVLDAKGGTVTTVNVMKQGADWPTVAAFEKNFATWAYAQCGAELGKAVTNIPDITAAGKP